MQDQFIVDMTWISKYSKDKPMLSIINEITVSL